MQFCAVGALLAVAYRLTGQRDEAVRVAGIAANVLTRGYGPTGDGVETLITINDAHGRDVVLGHFDRRLMSVAV